MKETFYKEKNMPKKKYIVNLSKTVKEELKSIISSGKNSAKKILKSRVLLKVDQGWTDKKVS
jgi:hypothetical protein